MELQGEDGSVVELSESAPKELGRGPGFAPHDRTVSRRHARLQVQRIAASRFGVSIEVIGPNPVCVIHSKGANHEVEIAKPGTQSSLETGDKFSLSIQEPVFYTLQEPVARVGLGPPPRLVARDQSDANDDRDGGERNQRTEAADPDEEEGIAEAVARWQRRKQERLQGGATGDRTGGQLGGERKQAEDIISEQALDIEPTDGPRAGEDDADLVKRFGFIVEGSEFERYGKKGLDTSKWDWQIGRPPANDSDEDEGGQTSHDQTGKRSRITAGLKANQKAKRANDDDDDDWRGDSEGEQELLKTGRRPVPRKKDVQIRSRALATSSSEPEKKRKSVSASEHCPDVKSTRVNSRQATASTSAKKITKRKSRAEEDDEEEDDDGEDLDGFLVDDVEEEDEPEVADDEDEWTDEDEDGDEDEEENEIDEGRGAGHASAPSRPVKDNELDRGDEKPLCKYGNKCFRKNKDHLAQFRH